MQMRAAGFLEGYITAEQMFDNHQVGGCIWGVDTAEQGKQEG